MNSSNRTLTLTLHILFDKVSLQKVYIYLYSYNYDQYNNRDLKSFRYRAVAPKVSPAGTSLLVLDRPVEPKFWESSLSLWKKKKPTSFIFFNLHPTPIQSISLGKNLSGLLSFSFVLFYYISLVSPSCAIASSAVLLRNPPTHSSPSLHI